MYKTNNTPFMLISKIVLIICVAGMYFMQANVGIPVYGAMTESGIGGDLNVNYVLEILLVTGIIGFVSIVIAIIGGAMRESKPFFVITIVIKCIMIPFFGINLFMWILLFGGMLNPFLLFGIPAMMTIGGILTYIYMLITSLPDIIYTIIFLIKNRLRPNMYIVIGLICMFLFVVDVVGAFILNYGYKKLIKAQEEAQAEVQAG